MDGLWKQNNSFKHISLISKKLQKNTVVKLYHLLYKIFNGYNNNKLSLWMQMWLYFIITSIITNTSIGHTIIILLKSSSYNIWHCHHLMYLIIKVSFQTTQKCIFFYSILKQKIGYSTFIYTPIFSSLGYCCLYLSFSSKIKKFYFRNLSYCSMFYIMSQTMHIMSSQNHKPLC